MKPKSKKHNAQDLTLRNLRALKNRVEELEMRLNGLADVQCTIIEEVEWLGGFKGDPKAKKAKK